MDKSNVSSSLEYFLYKERQVKNMPLKRLLLSIRKFFQKTTFSYTLFKSFFGYIFFCSPLILVILLFNKTYLIDYGSCNIEAFILPLISSICFLILFCLLLMIWRIISSIKAKNFYSWDRQNCGSLLETIIVLSCSLSSSLKLYNHFNQLKASAIESINSTFKSQETNIEQFFWALNYCFNPLMSMISFLYFRLLFIKTKNTFFYILVYTILSIELLMIRYNLFTCLIKQSPIALYFICEIIYRLSRLCDRKYKKKKNFNLINELLMIASQTSLLILTVVLMIKTFLGDKFTYDDIVIYSLIAYLISYSYYFGDHFVELLFKPIEKEYFSVKPMKSKISLNTTRATQISKNINAPIEEPFIHSDNNQ